VAPGGFDSAYGQIPTYIADRYPDIYTAGALWQTWSAEDVLLWEGQLLDPVPEGTTVALNGRGWRFLAEHEAGRMCFVNRTYEDWVTWDSEPHSYRSRGTAYETNIVAGAIRFVGRGGEPIHGDISGGPASVAFTVNHESGNSGNHDIEILSCRGPGGPLTLERVIEWTDGAVEDVLINGTRKADQIVIRLIRTGADSENGLETPVRLWLTDVRVRALSSRDKMSSDAVVREVCRRIGVSDFGISGGGENVMPLDFKGGTYAELLDYVSMVSSDPVWRILSTGQGPICYFNNGDRWFTSRQDGLTELLPASRYNKVIITYPTTIGRTSTVTVIPSDIGRRDPLPQGYVNAFHLELTEPQHNNDVPRHAAERILELLIRRRWTGRLERTHIENPRGHIVDARTLHAGDRLTLKDATTHSSATVRVARTRKTDQGTTFDLEERDLALDSYLTRRGWKQ
jgi:hypothetical protein